MKEDIVIVKTAVAFTKLYDLYEQMCQKLDIEMAFTREQFTSTRELRDALLAESIAVLYGAVLDAATQQEQSTPPTPVDGKGNKSKALTSRKPKALPPAGPKHQ